jgi:hypothetical protein
MEFFFRNKPEFVKYYQIGMQLELSMGEKLIWVTVSKIVDDAVFFKTNGEDEKYLEDLFEEKFQSFSIETKSQ